jgi:hypothetical protein
LPRSWAAERAIARALWGSRAPECRVLRVTPHCQGGCPGSGRALSRLGACAGREIRRCADDHGRSSGVEWPLQNGRRQAGLGAASLPNFNGPRRMAICDQRQQVSRANNPASWRGLPPLRPTFARASAQVVSVFGGPAPLRMTRFRPPARDCGEACRSSMVRILGNSPPSLGRCSASRLPLRCTSPCLCLEKVQGNSLRRHSSSSTRRQPR